MSLGGAQRRAVLTVLAVDGGHAVPAERIVETLWPDGPPVSAAQTVQSHVSHLRKTMGASRIETVPGGYLLQLDGLEVDAMSFERGFDVGRHDIERGAPSEAVAVLARALARWRGRAYEDAEWCERAAAEAARLDDLRTSAIELLLEARLAIGDHDRVAAEAETAIARWPLRERMWAALMVGLYRCGRHADALAAYQRVRTILGEELGLEPSPSLSDLEARILRHDPTLLAANPAERLGADLRSADPVVVDPRLAPSSPLGNVPARPATLIGRERESQQVADALMVGPIVTLTGVGGVGKTRLAVEVASTGHGFPDGAWLCELAAVDSPEAVLQVVAATLGVPSRAGVDLTEGLLDFLRTKSLLLVLDNCEHVLTTAGDLAEMLSSACPGVRILATSREGLAVDGEHVIPLRSLEVPAPAAGSEEIASSASVQLFVERALAAGGELAPEQHDLSAIADICRRLDGVPLALELAAARTAAMSPADIAAHIDERFRLLTGGRRSAVERHQTLRAAVDWSYGLLAPRDRAVFDRLGVFAGGFDLSAAEGVVVDEEITAFDVLDALTSLVAKSMIVAGRSFRGTVRYRLLETMRQYARDRLDESGSGDHWRRRHARHYGALAREAGPHLQGPDETSWRARVTEDLDNLRAAVGWALDRDDDGDAHLGVEIVVALVNEGIVRRASGIGSWSFRVLEREDILTPSQRHDVRTGAAWEMYWTGDFEGARDMARGAVADGVPVECTYGGGSFIAMATSSTMLGDLDGARAAYRAGRESVRGRSDEGFSMAAMLAAESMNLSAFGLRTEAREAADEALRLALEVRNPTVLVLANFAQGWALTADDPDGARVALEECIALSDSGATDGTVGSALARVAPLRMRAGDTAGAIDALSVAFARLRELGDRTSLATVIHAAMGVLLDLGATDAAALAALLLDRPDVTTGPFAAIEPGRREAFIDDIGGTAPELLDTARRRSAQLSTDEVLDVLITELSRHRSEPGPAAADGGRMSR